MKSIYFSFLLFLVICFSCQNNEHEQLLIETQQAYLEELEEKEQLLWDILESKFYKNKIDYYDFNQLELYRLQFKNALNNPSQDEINQLSLKIDSFKIEHWQDDELQSIDYSYNENKFDDMISHTNYKLELMNTHNDFIKLIINNTSFIDCSFPPPPILIAMPNYSKINKGEKLNTVISFFTPRDILFDSIYFGEFDLSKIDTSTQSPYQAENASDVPLISYTSFEYGNYLNHSFKTDEIGLYTKSGVIPLVSHKGGYDFFPFEFSYEVVDCP